MQALGQGHCGVAIAVGDVWNDGKEEVVASISGYGLGVYDNMVGWTRINWTPSEDNVCADIDNDGKKEVLSDFASLGIWGYN